MPEIPEIVLNTLVAGVVALITLIAKDILDKQRNKNKMEAEEKKVIADATEIVTRAASSVVTEIQEENAGLRSMLSEFHRRLEALEKENKELRDKLNATSRKLTRTSEELKKTSLKLEMAQETIGIVLEWVNEYQPALDEAGIKPPEIEEHQFRGGDEEIKL